MFKKLFSKRVLAVIMAAMICCSTATAAYADETDTEEYGTVSVGEEIAVENENENENESHSVAVDDINSIVSEVVSNANSDDKSDSDSDSDSEEEEDSAADTDTVASNSSDTDDTDIIPDYYGDDKYDTSGNLSLVKEQKIIYDSSEMQFIAVTTKSGNIFYILIDYTAIEAAENGEEGANARETVYFLNKVDDYDLYSILYEDSESVPYYSAANDSSYSESEETMVSDTDSDTAVSEQSGSGSDLTFYIILIVAVAVVGGGYYFLKIKPKKNQTVEEDDDDDFDFEDEPEINEDDEGKKSDED